MSHYLYMFPRGGVPERSKRTVQLTLDQFDESDDDYGSDDSYIPEEDHLSDSDHDSGSEIDVNDVISASDDEEAAGCIQRGGNKAVTEPVGVFHDFHVFYVSLEENIT
jgi:hypothetical protein